MIDRRKLLTLGTTSLAGLALPKLGEARERRRRTQCCTCRRIECCTCNCERTPPKRYDPFLVALQEGWFGTIYLQPKKRQPGRWITVVGRFIDPNGVPREIKPFNHVHCSSDHVTFENPQIVEPVVAYTRFEIHWPSPEDTSFVGWSTWDYDYKVYPPNKWRYRRFFYDRYGDLLLYVSFWYQKPS